MGGSFCDPGGILMLRQCLSPSRGFGKAREDLKSWWSFSKTVRLRRCVKGISKGLESKIVFPLERTYSKDSFYIYLCQYKETLIDLYLSGGNSCQHPKFPKQRLIMVPCGDTWFDTTLIPIQKRTAKQLWHVVTLKQSCNSCDIFYPWTPKPWKWRF